MRYNNQKKVKAKKPKNIPDENGIIKAGKHGKYRLKRNPKRFFKPNEWDNFHAALPENNKFFFNFLFQTGMRYNEGKNVRVKDINYEDRNILVANPKGGRGRERNAHFTKEFGNELIKYIREHRLRSEDRFGFKTIQNLRAVMQNTCKKIGIKDYKDFSIHNLRKTHENYLLYIGKNTMMITQHIGHNKIIASQHYASGEIIKNQEEIDKMHKWFGGMFE